MHFMISSVSVKGDEGKKKKEVSELKWLEFKVDRIMSRCFFLWQKLVVVMVRG